MHFVRLYIPMASNYTASKWWMQAVKARFDIMDQDKNGVVCRKDYELFADKCAALIKTADENETRKKVMTVWKAFGTPDDFQLTFDMFVPMSVKFIECK